MATPTSRLEAINRIGAECGFARFSTDDTTGSFPALTFGTSDAGNMSFHLEQVSREIQTRAEHPANVIPWKELTITSSGNLSFATSVLSMTPVGKYKDRRWTLRYSGSTPIVYDNENDTSTFASGTYTFSVAVYLEFTDLPQEYREIIISEAIRRYQQTFLGNAQKDAFLKERSIQTGVAARTINPPVNRERMGMTPSTLVAAANTTRDVQNAGA